MESEKHDSGIEETNVERHSPIDHINPYIRKIRPYKSASHKIWEVTVEERENILKLDWNEATISPSPKVIERIKKIVEVDKFYHLYPLTKNDNLLALISDYVDLPMEYIQYFAGSDSIHEYLAKLYVSDGDDVIIQAPSYDNFRLTVESCGGRVFFSEINQDFSFDEKRFEEDLERIRPRLVYICNPNNPLGYSHSTGYIEKLLMRYPATIFLVDEAYAEFSGKSCKDLVLKHNNLLITRTLSKAFALANFRFGYLISSPGHIRDVSSIRNPKNVSTFAQEAAMGALQDVEYMQDYVDEVNKSKEIFIEEMNKYSGFVKPYESEANFVTLDFKSNSIKSHFIEYLLENKIYIRDLSHSPLLARCVRITIGTREQMSKVLRVVGEFFEKENSNGEASII